MRNRVDVRCAIGSCRREHVGDLDLGGKDALERLGVRPVVVRSHDIPREALGDAFSAIAQGDALTPIELTELEEEARKVLDAGVGAALGAVEDEHSILKSVGHVPLDVGAETT